MAAADFSEMTVTVLKAELRERGLPVSGNKGDLVKRLEDHEAGTSEPAVGAAEDGAVQNAADAPSEAAQPAEGEAATPGAVPESEGQGAGETNGEKPSGPEDAAEKRIARFGKTVLKDDEKAQRREDRFKTVDPIADSKTVESRAARFGILTEQAVKEKEVSRAKRFNVDTPELMAEKKKARDSRFAAPAPAGPKESHTVNEIAAMINKKG